MSGDWTSSLKGYWGIDTIDFKKNDSLVLWEVGTEEINDSTHNLSKFALSLSGTPASFLVLMLLQNPTPPYFQQTRGDVLTAAT